MWCWALFTNPLGFQPLQPSQDLSSNWEFWADYPLVSEYEWRVAEVFLLLGVFCWPLLLLSLTAQP